MAIRKTTKQFIKDAIEIRGNKYDYTKVVYVNAKTKVCIICPIHGEFWQLPNAHLSGQDCPDCAKIKRNSSHRTKYENLIFRFKQIHGNLYQYPEFEFKTQHDKIKIYCNKHKFWFNQQIVHHLNGHGCPICNGGGNHWTTEMFVIKAKEIHGNRYDYSKVLYKNKETKVEITCPIHGSFLQKPHDHISGCGCPKCKSFRTQEKIYDFLKQTFVEEIWEWEYSPDWLGLQRFDIYNVIHNLAIEYNGEQHYIPVERFGGKLGHEQCIKRDLQKEQLCKKNNCTLYVIKYDNVNYNKIKEDINNILNNNCYENCIKQKQGK